MQEVEEFPYENLFQTLRNANQLERNFKYFTNEYKKHNMLWVYQSIAAFQKILTDPRQLPLVKFNTLLAIKNCFDTCQYALVTLIQVYLLSKITQIALFRTKVKDQSMLATYFATLGYKQQDHGDLKKVSYNYVALAIQFVFVSSQIKQFRCVQNFQIKQSSKYSMSAQMLTERGIKSPEKLSYFLSNYLKQKSQKYLDKLIQFADQEICEIYSEYFLGVMIGQLQTGKKGPLQIRSLLSFGDAYLTSAMINLCQDQLNSIPEGIQNKRKYLGLFHQFVRWGDIQAVLMINTSDFITNISVSICNVRGDINLSQGENIYPQIQGKHNQKREFYTDFLRCLETWAECIPLNEQGNQSNVRKIYKYLKQQKKFKFPQNLIINRYRKQLEENIKRNDERNQKLLQIINEIEQEENQNIQTPSIKEQISRQTTKKAEILTFGFLQKQVQNVTNTLSQIVDIKFSDKQALNNLTECFQGLEYFKQNWVGWLQKIDLDGPQAKKQDEQQFQQIILNGDELIQAIQIIQPLVQIFSKKKITLQELLKRIKQGIQTHQDSALSHSKQKEMTKSLRKSQSKSVKNSLTKTIHKSILNNSGHKVQTASKLDWQVHQNPMGRSKNSSGTSSVVRKSKIYSKIKKAKQNSSQIEQLMESRNLYFESEHQKLSIFQRQQVSHGQNLVRQPSAQVLNLRYEGQTLQYYEQGKQKTLGTQQVVKQERKYGYASSRKSSSRQKSSMHNKKQNSLKSSKKHISSGSILSSASSRNVRSQKDITVVSRSNSSQMDALQQQSRKIIADMNLSNDAQNIVIQYSDIDEKQFGQKATQKQKQDIVRDRLSNLKKKQLEQAFIKSKVQQTKKTQPKQQKLTPRKKLQVSQSGHSEARQPHPKQTAPEKNKQTYKKREKQDENGRPSNNKVEVFKKNNIIVIKDKIKDRLKSLNQDYGGIDKRSEKQNQVESPKQQDISKQNKKTQSKASIDCNDSRQSDKSYKLDRQKSRCRNNEEKSLIRQKSQRSLQSQVGYTRQVQGKSIQNRPSNYEQRDLPVAQNPRESKIKIGVNVQYNHQSNKPNQSEIIQADFKKVNKVMQTGYDQKHRTKQISQNQKHQSNSIKKQNKASDPNNERNLQKKDRSSSSIGSKIRKHGISLSLGKKGPLQNKQSFPKKYPTEEAQYIQHKTNQPQQEEKLRQQYFNRDLKILQHSNLTRYKGKLQPSRNRFDGDSCCGDIIQNPDNQPMLQSYYMSKDLQKNRNYALQQKLQFRKCIGNELKKQVISSKYKQVRQIIESSGSKDRQIKNNSQTSKAKSQQKYFYGSFLKGRAEQKLVSQLQDKLKALEKESINMKTKLVIRDQQITSFKNISDKGYVQFSTPSQSNYFSSTDCLKTSKISIDKVMFSPKAHQLLRTQFQTSLTTAQIKHVKSTPFNQYFQKMKGNSFRKTLLKSKSLIQKQDEIEIGYMSVRKDDFSLQVTIFITPLRFDLTDVNYSIIADENLNSDCYPKNVANIPLKKQQKISIKISVKSIPFSIPEFQLTYKSISEYSKNYFKIPMPTLFNKFCQIQSVPIQSFESKYSSAQKVIKTSEFKLNTKVIKLQKVKQILPNFSYAKTKDLHILTAIGVYKQSNFWIIAKINQKNHVILQGFLQEGQDFKHLQFLLITLRNIFQAQR